MSRRSHGHGPRMRATRVMKDSYARVDTRAMGGPVVKYTLGPACGRSRGPGHDRFYFEGSVG